MARPRPHRVAVRGAPPLEELASLPSSDLVEITIRAPGMVVTTGDDTPWRASPRYMAEADRLLRERGYWEARKTGQEAAGPQSIIRKQNGED